MARKILCLPLLDVRQVSRLTLQVLVQEDTTDPHLLDQIARAHFGDSPLMSGLIRHRRVPEHTLRFLIQVGPPEIQEQIRTGNVTGQVSGQGGSAPAESEHHGPPGRKHPMAEVEKSTYGFIKQMSVAEKIQFALRADKSARALLLKDSNRLVSIAVLESPKITEEEVESVAQSRNVSEEVLRTISKKREWLSNYLIVHALVNNPKTPVGISLSLLPTLKTKDLGLILKNRGVPEAVRAVATKLYRTRARA